MPQSITTVREAIAWTYANLGMADAALKEQAITYTRVHYMIRSRLYKGLVTQKMSMRSLYDDERLKMTLPQVCCYCGCATDLSLDHLIPRIKGGTDEGDNLVWACRSCNSSKGGKDMLEWMWEKDKFPPVLLLRRYMKLVARYCDRMGCMDLPLEKSTQMDLPFNLGKLPAKFPPLAELRLWIVEI